MAKAYTLGIDYGTNSVRALVVGLRATGGRSAPASSTTPRATRASCSTRSDPHLARQNPADYLAGLERVGERRAGGGRERRRASPGPTSIGIGVDTTGSTPIPVDAQSRPLALDPKWQANLAAQAWLWKDHTGGRGGRGDHRDRGRSTRPQYLAPDRRHLLLRVVLVEDLALPEGGARRLRRRRQLGGAGRLHPGGARRASPTRARSSAASAPPATRRCTPTTGAACPTKEFLARLDPKLADLRDRLYDKAYPADRPAGTLCAGVGRRRSACAEGIPIAMGAFDAHYGAVGRRRRARARSSRSSAPPPATAPSRRRRRRSPTSPASAASSTARSCRATTASRPASRRSATSCKWWVEGVCEGDDALHARADRARRRSCGPGESGLVALDWNNGNRTILVDPRLTGLLARPDAAHDARRGLPRAHRGHRVRRARDHRAHARVRRPDRARRLLRRHRREERRSSCRSTPT